MFHTRFRDVDGEVEDRLASALPVLYPESAPACVGQPGQRLVYESALLGELPLAVPDYSRREDEQPADEAAVERARRLFAHYLWGSALLVADGVERAAAREAEDTEDRDRGTEDAEDKEDSTEDKEDREDGGRRDDLQWSVKGHRVLEVGAGVGLPSIVSVLAGAASVTVTDHPSAPGLSGPLQANIAANVPQRLAERIAVQPYRWGVFDEAADDDDDDEMDPSHLPGMARFAAANRGAFTRIICADCLWMPSQHANLVRSLAWFLAPAGVAWVVAGLHTGRQVVADFFQRALSAGLAIQKIWERDMNATEDMAPTRAWQPVRADEGPENRARWCVVAMLVRRTETET